MRGTVAKRIRREAERLTPGKKLRRWVKGANRLHEDCTRFVYRVMKFRYKMR